MAIQIPLKAYPTSRANTLERTLCNRPEECSPAVHYFAFGGSTAYIGENEYLRAAMLREDTSKNIASEIVEDEALEPEKTIRCKSCEHQITKQSLAIEPHEHTFRNPLGLSFHIACYSDAPGAIDIGIPTTVATWFPNYAWSMAHCAQCHHHIGWWFHGPDKFAGLIVTRLIR